MFSLSSPLNIRFWARWEEERSKLTGPIAIRNVSSKKIAEYARNVQTISTVKGILSRVRQKKTVTVNGEQYPTDTKENAALASVLRERLGNLAKVI